MMNVCFQCGIYRADKTIDPSGPFAICPECGHKHAFRQMPLLIVSGASGTGKSTVCQQLLGKVTNAVLLDADILWRSEFNTPASNYNDFFETWLRMCKNISQSGRPVVLFGAGVGVPENIENLIERRYFSKVHYLALVCEDEVLSKRLLERPAWRGTHDPRFVKDQVSFNRWFKSYTGQPMIELADTTHSLPEATERQVMDWIGQVIGVTRQ